MESLLGSIGSIFSGGLVGLIGSGITAWSDYKKQKLMFEHDEKMAQLEMDRDEQKYNFEMRKVQAEVEGEKEVAREESLQASHNSDKATYSNVSQNWVFFIVDAIRGLVRPVLTVMSAIIMWSLYSDLQVMYDSMENLTATDVKDLFSHTINVILFIATTAITWWFGGRSKVVRFVGNDVKKVKL